MSSSLVQDKKEFYVGQKKCLETLTVLVGALLVVVITPGHEKISGIANIIHFGLYSCEVGLTAENVSACVGHSMRQTTSYRTVGDVVVTERPHRTSSVQELLVRVCSGHLLRRNWRRCPSVALPPPRLERPGSSSYRSRPDRIRPAPPVVGRGGKYSLCISNIPAIGGGSKNL